MKLFLDTANVKEIEHINKWGVIDGITTNQKIFLAEKGVDFKQRVLEIVGMTKGPVSIELTKKSVADMVKEAETYHSWSPERIAIKVAMSGDGLGLEVINILHQKGIRINATCMMNFAQGLLAAKAGADYVSLFYRRAMDSGLDPVEEIRRLRYFIDDSKLPSEIIAGSIREVGDVCNALAAGAHIPTIPYKIFIQMPFHQKSEDTIAEFDKSWLEFLKNK